jgi:phosphate transport system substrate-binding protein
MQRLMLGVAAAAMVVACKGGGDSSPSPSGSGSAAQANPASAEVSLNGSGASFPQPLYSKWIDTYQTQNKGIKINYQSVGSGAGIKNISDKTVDFGASDAPMNDEQLGKATGGKIVHVPMTLGAVVLTYNIPGAPDHLKLSPEVVSAIFLGEVTTWNDAKITALNPDAKLPAQKIGVVYRSDGSGTTAVFTDYLSKASAPFKEKVGTGTSVK